MTHERDVENHFREALARLANPFAPHQHPDRELLLDYAYEQLSEKVQSVVEYHLMACQECTQIVQELKEEQEQLKRGLKKILPDSPEILRRISHKEPASAEPSRIPVHEPTYRKPEPVHSFGRVTYDPVTKPTLALEHVYQVSGSWQGGLQGKGWVKNADQTLKVELGAPEESGGLGGRVTPEELFLASACSCYLVTLAMTLEKMRLPVKKLECTAEGRITPDQEGGYNLQELVLHPHVEMDGDPKTHDQGIMRAVKLAEQRCIISRAVRGTIAYQVHHPQIAKPEAKFTERG